MQQGQLEAFLSVARLGNITRASEELFLVQSSLSARIQALEEELGAQLLLRTRRGTVLTETGRYFLPFARAALEAMEEGKRKVAEVRDGYFSELEVAATPTISTYLLPTIVKLLTLAHPGVKVRIHTGRPDDILQWVINGLVTIGFSQHTVHPDIVARPIHLEELILVAPPQHPLAATGKVKIGELAEIGLISYGRKSTYHELTWSLFQSAQLRPRFSHEVDNIEATKHLVLLNLGIAIVPAYSVESELRSGSLVRIRITDAPAIRRNIYLIQRIDAVPSEAARQFLLAANSVVHPADKIVSSPPTTAGTYEGP